MMTLAFAETSQGVSSPAAVNTIMNFLPIIIIFVIFYFLLIRPQKKSQQEHAKMLENLQKNDEVITIGGMYGTILNVEKQSDVVTLRIDDNTRIKIQKSAISKLKK
ncbi:MAG: preprotein translocase subunit YajC [Candidatus Omnitrophica bacterium]|nr:preprotein translocase subunit YajC [Candidatus Omnitrophota bacterium]